MRHVLVTGANGFIGRALCERLLAEGWQVRGAVRSKVSRIALPAGVVAAPIGSIGSDTEWGEALAGIDTVVHLAARVHVMDDSASDPLAAYREVNVEGTKCLAIAAANAGVKRFVYISSVKVNGESTGDSHRRASPLRHSSYGYEGREAAFSRRSQGYFGEVGMATERGQRQGKRVETVFF